VPLGTEQTGTLYRLAVVSLSEVLGRNWHIWNWALRSLNPRRRRESFQHIAEFLTGHHPEVPDDRVLATVLFTDIVDGWSHHTTHPALMPE
jgi:hypothetical protein